MRKFLIRRKPGWLLKAIAGAPVPVLGAERFAAREPDRPEARDEHGVSPLVEPVVGVPRGARRGPLDGDVVIKDQIDVAGCPTGVGCANGGAVAAVDAEVVARIVAGGGRIIGKAKMTELGIDGLGVVMHYPTPVNPRAPGYSPGGSSTGTAVAVAAGLARYGVGGDGLGSIRIPAAFCGLYGLKTSREGLPRAGICSPVRTLDAIGPITRTVEDCATLWHVMAGEPVVKPVAWVPERVGVPIGRTRVARAVATAFDRALAALGVVGERVELPGLHTATFLGGMIGAHELATGPMAAMATSRAAKMSLAVGGALSTDDAQVLYRRRDALRAATNRVLERTPILALPTTAIPPPAMTRALVGGGQELLLLRALGAFTPIANLADLPSIAAPCGIDERGRPLSIMFIGTRGSEGELLRIAAALEETKLATKPVGPRA
ncbi:MAG: amidase [Deltaproteobacteria bacterium]|nr:amidase [Deltaproteobacteria bacterium]